MRNEVEPQNTPNADRKATSTPPDSGTSAGLDRRLHPRYALSLAITLSGENNFYAGLTEDISEGGVFIATHRLLPIGTPVVMSFSLPHARKILEVHGVVRWLRGPDALRKPGYMYADLDSGVSAGMA